MTDNNCEICTIQKPHEASMLNYKQFIIPVVSGLLILAAWVTFFTNSIYSSDQKGAIIIWNDLLGVIATIIAGYPIIKCGIEQTIKTIRKRDIAELNMGVLITIALFASLEHGEFIAAATVAFIMIVGMLLEDIILYKAHNAVSKIMSLIPDTATVMRDGHEVIVPSGEIVPGDIIRVKTGERIAVDGVVVHGHGDVNQAPITGESMPVNKTIEDEVFEGTLLEEGFLEIKATKTGQDSTLAKIAQLVDNSQQSKTHFQRIADRFANYFTPFILGLALLAYAITGEGSRAVTILIVACPCALVLAAPTAIIATVARCARNGIIIKGGEPLEAAGQINMVLFDKTGTLTEGVPHIKNIITFDSMPENEMLKWAASAESASEHPLAKCIVKHARQNNIEILKPEIYKVHIGKGVSAKVNGTNIIVGRKQLFSDLNYKLGDKIIKSIEDEEAKGQTIVLVSEGDKPIGMLCLSDKIKDTSAEVKTELDHAGIFRTAIVTGDNRANAENVAKQLSIDEVHYELLPEEKLKIVQDYEKSGTKVAMVGDGINDAPALAEATVGIAMGKNGTDVAVEVAGIAIMSDEPSKIAYALRSCRRAYSVIKGNIWASIVVNIIAIVLSTTGTLTPVWAALVHNVASFAVVGNSARLIKAKKK